MQEMIQHQIPEIRIGLTDSILQLIETIRRPLNKVSVIILFVRSIKEIKALTAITPLFDDIRLILILADSNSDTVSSGLKLSPCFTTHFDAAPADVISVLKKISVQEKEKLFIPALATE
jgi:hypothetical protein